VVPAAHGKELFNFIPRIVPLPPMATPSQPMSDSPTTFPPAAAGSAREVLAAFLRLGCVSFGGPIAHLGYFHAEFVKRRRWCSEESYAEIVALAQSLPGPASSQVGFALGLLRAGWLGGLAAWAGFTLPSALLMLAFAMEHTRLTGKLGLGIVHGLQLVAVAVVAQAILAMRKKLAPDALRLALALLAAAIVYFSGQTLLAIAIGALIGGLLLGQKPSPQLPLEFTAGCSGVSSGGLSRRAGLAAGAAFCALLLLLPIAASLSATHSAGQPIAVANAFFRSGALVFGGGHVVLPLLERAVVARGWVDQAAFLSGYGAAQALPGPLFTFAAYLGAVIRPTPSPVTLGALALVAIFLPGLLLIAALLPFWNELRQRRRMQSCLAGVNAAVVGVLLAAFIRPVWSSAVHSPFDLAVALAALGLLVRYKLPPWLVVVCVALLSALAQIL
jgi:chromate transporter